MRSTNKAESMAAAVADGAARGLNQGYGEILDEGQMSKAEVAEAIPYLDPLDDAAVSRYIAENDFSDLGFPKLDRMSASQHMVMHNLRRQNLINNAPVEHIYDYRYYP